MTFQPASEVARTLGNTPSGAARFLPPLAWGRVPTQATSKAVYVAPKTRQSARLKGMFYSGPIKKGPTVTIDLDSESKPQWVGLTGEAPTIGVAETGASHASVVQRKGKVKHLVTIVEKGIQIMESKEKRMKPIWKN
jgi:hypothetical protein